MIEPRPGVSGGSTPRRDDGHEAVVAGVVGRLGRERRHLVAWLRAVQQELGYVPLSALERIAATTEATLAELTDVVTFHPGFRLTPGGRHRIRVCVGTACHVKGAESLFETFRASLGIEGDADTDSEGLFTVEKVACLGCCSLAPAVQLGELLYGPVANADVPRVLRDFLETADTPHEPSSAVDEKPPSLTVRLCTCTSCAAAGAVKTAAALRTEAQRLGLRVRVVEAACRGASFDAPLVDVVAARSVFHYARVRPHHAESMLLAHAKNRTRRFLGTAIGRLVERLPVANPREDAPRRYWPDALPGCECRPDGFWERQMRIATAQAGELDPLDLEAYRATGGFAEISRSLAGRTSDDMIGVLREAGLRGRGGAGYPTAEKWAAVSQSSDPLRFVVCNGDEGDPGAFMDRMVLESFPFRVLEGMLVAARVLRARMGFLYIRAEYPLATKRVRAAIAACERAGLLGGEAPVFEVVEGAGAFVCGEETALLASIEGRRGMPSPRPPFPSERGLWGHPTLVNNVETFASLPWILRNGATAFRRQGTSSSPGTKAFALAGDVRHGGLVEVPMGSTLRELVEQVGGGTTDGRPFKAVQVGGPSGGCVSYAESDVPVDYEALLSAGAMMGSGGLVVLGQRDCIVDIVRYFLRFTQSESCGRCVPCRMGSRRMLAMLDELATGTARPGILAELERTAAYVKANSLCGLGRSAPNPVLSALRHFRPEFEAHLLGQCPAGRCKGIGRRVVTDDCIGCTRCAQVCPVNAVRSVAYTKHGIDPLTCTLCDACVAACPAGAIEAR